MTKLEEEIKRLNPFNQDSPAHEYFNRGFNAADAIWFKDWCDTNNNSRTSLDLIVPMHTTSSLYTIYLKQKQK